MVASAANTGKVVASGKPNRIAKHIVRKSAHKVLAKMLRGL